jgi:uncharacterized SAM-binding protein YcdF (DUF218 family)
MELVLAKLFGTLLAPSNLLLLLLVAGLVLRLAGGQGTRIRRFGAVLVGAAALGLAAAAILPLGAWLARPLEARFALSPPGPVDGIIVLGGSIDPEASAARGRPHLRGDAERLTEFVRLARQHPEARLVFSGGSSRIGGGRPESEAAAGFFAELGIAPERLLLEAESRTTCENARHSLALALPKPGERWLLVTSAVHMPRAVLCFRAVGWDVVAVPVAPIDVARSERRITLALGLRDLDRAAHEWLGLIAYRLLGHTTRLLPER